MTKFKKKISNPMTIIAIFATLSETSAAVSLPFLSDDEREIYIWFLISFPFYLLFLFFITLNFNYRSLYSPSDFDKEKHFIKVIDNAERSENKKQQRPNDSPAKQKRPVTTPTSETTLPDQPSKAEACRYRLWSAQDLSVDICLQTSLRAQHNTRLQGPLKNLRIVDTRGISTKVDVVNLMETLRESGRHCTHVVVFLACGESEKLLRERTLKCPKQIKKGTCTTSWIVYNLNSHDVTVLDKT
ncbi:MULTISPECIES: hypothetical protein [unclassified Pseudomonas]|uniref:hypothetical protein n=1 Tax=unclassified Pseudomonas TaxID=196821 RepID=UPI002AC9BC45|nr:MULTISPECIES: hypothetical protein [unclassified Pseudomonas]MEB0045045.1 hypothetical protein [Pseudomonas sp. Dout3]MEB0095943.1 hypothetical protein [Pseudomonas sp. DC1.2]WPX57810.1 hypothetical protein RHM68_19665 [Pseudomonas sp. DC1.2]